MRDLLGMRWQGLKREKKLVEGFEETFMKGTPLNLCDFFPFLRWVDYKGVEKSLRVVQGKRDEFLQGLVD